MTRDGKSEKDGDTAAQVAAAMLTSDLYASTTDFGDDFMLDEGNNGDEEEKVEETPEEPVVPVRRNQILSSTDVSRRRARPGSSSAATSSSVAGGGGKDSRRRASAASAVAASGSSGGSSSAVDRGQQQQQSEPRTYERRDSKRGGSSSNNNNKDESSNKDRERRGTRDGRPQSSNSSNNPQPRRNSSSGDMVASTSQLSSARRNSSSGDMVASSSQLSSGRGRDRNLKDDNDAEGGTVKERRAPRRSRSNDLVEARSNHSTSSGDRTRANTTNSSNNGDAHTSSVGGGGDRPTADRSTSSSTLGGRRRRRGVPDGVGAAGNAGSSGSGDASGQRSSRRRGEGGGSSGPGRDRDAIKEGLAGIDRKNSRSHTNLGNSGNLRTGDEDDGTIISRRARRRAYHRRPVTNPNNENGRGESNGASYREGLVALNDSGPSGHSTLHGSGPSGMDINASAHRSSSRTGRDGGSSSRRRTRSKSQSRSRSKSPRSEDPDAADTQCEEPRRRPLRRTKSAEGSRIRSAPANDTGERKQSNHESLVLPDNDKSQYSSSLRGRRGSHRDKHSARSKSLDRKKASKLRKEERLQQDPEAPRSARSNAMDKPTSYSSRAEKIDGKSSQRGTGQESSIQDGTTSEKADGHSRATIEDRVAPVTRDDDTNIEDNAPIDRLDQASGSEDETDSDDDDGTVATLSSIKSTNSPSRKSKKKSLLKSLLKVTSKKKKDVDETAIETESDKKPAADPSCEVPLEEAAGRAPADVEDNAMENTDKKSTKWSGIRSGFDFTRRLVANKDKKSQEVIDAEKKKETEELEKVDVEEGGQRDDDIDTDRGSVIDESSDAVTEPNGEAVPKKSKKWNIAAKLKRSVKEKSDSKQSGAEGSEDEDETMSEYGETGVPQNVGEDDDHGNEGAENPDDQKQRKKSKWNLASKLKISRQEKGKSDVPAPSAVGDTDEAAKPSDDNSAPGLNADSDKPKKANKWNLAAKIKKNLQQEEEETKEPEADDMNYGLMMSMDSFSEDALKDLQDVREAWSNNGSRENVLDDEVSSPIHGQDDVGDDVGTSNVQQVEKRAPPDRRAMFGALAQPSMRFDFSSDAQAAAVPTRQSVSDIHNGSRESIDEEATSHSSSSLEVDVAFDDDMDDDEKRRESTRSGNERSRSTDSDELNASHRSSSNPPDRRLVFSKLAEPSMKFDFSNNHLDKSTESMQVSTNEVLVETDDEDASEAEEIGDTKKEVTEAQLPQKRDELIKEDPSSSEDEEEEDDDFDDGADLQLASAVADAACIQIDFAAASDASAANIRAHKLTRDTSIYGFETQGAALLNKNTTADVVHEFLDAHDEQPSPIPEHDDAVSTDEVARLKEQLLASQERTKAARETLRALQQEVQNKKHRYGEAQRKRELAFKALERKNIVLERTPV